MNSCVDYNQPLHLQQIYSKISPSGCALIFRPRSVSGVPPTVILQCELGNFEMAITATKNVAQEKAKTPHSMT
jgi:hypothetical protein